MKCIDNVVLFDSLEIVWVVQIILLFSLKKNLVTINTLSSIFVFKGDILSIDEILGNILLVDKEPVLMPEGLKGGIQVIILSKFESHFRYW